MSRARRFIAPALTGLAVLVLYATVLALAPGAPPTSSGSPRPSRTLPVVIVAGQSNATGSESFLLDAPAPLKRDLDSLLGIPALIDETTLGHPARPLPHVSTLLAPQYSAGQRIFGPELSLADTLAAHGHTNTFMLKDTTPGSNLSRDWNPTATSGPRLYARLLADLDTVRRYATRRGQTVRVVALVWVQGESDSVNRQVATGYQRRLFDLIAHLRHDVISTGRIVIVATDVSRTIPFLRFIGGCKPSCDQVLSANSMVRRAQVAAGRLPGVTVIDSFEMEHRPDFLHLDASGEDELGVAAGRVIDHNWPKGA